MQSVLEGLRNTEKGRLIYHTQWSPKDLADDISPPKLRRSLEAQVFKVSDTKIVLEAIEDDAHTHIENSKLNEQEKGQRETTGKESGSEDEFPSHDLVLQAPLQKVESKLKEEHRRANFERVRKREEFNAKMLRETKEHFQMQRQRKIERREKENEQLKRYLRETQENAWRIMREEEEHQDRILKTRRQQQEERRLKLQLLETQKQKENFKKFIKTVQETQATYRQSLEKVQQLGNAKEISISQIPSLVENMNIVFNDVKAMSSHLTSSGKKEKIADEELGEMERNAQMIKGISDHLSKEADLVKSQIEEMRLKEEKVQQELIAKQKREEAENAARLAEQAAKVQSASVQPTTSSSNVEASPSLSDMYKTLKVKMGEYEAAGVQLTKSTEREMKMLAMNLSRAISVPVSSITDRSGSDVKSRLRILVNIIKGNAVSVGTKTVSTKGNENAAKFAVNLTAKKIVSQANEQVSANFTSAFSIAFMVMGIWAESSDFGDLFLAHLHAKCIFCVPMYLLKKDSETEEEHQKKLGYAVSEDGTVEQQDKYLRRMSGLVRLYAAVIQSPLPPGVNEHPYGLSKGWAWLAEVLNSEPQPDVSATVLYDFLEVAGHALMKAYKTQFEKLLYVLCHDYYPKLEEVTSPGHRAPLMRLKNFLEKCIKEKSVPVPKGRLDRNFWNTYHSGEVVGE